MYLGVKNCLDVFWFLFDLLTYQFTEPKLEYALFH